MRKWHDENVFAWLIWATVLVCFHSDLISDDIMETVWPRHLLWLRLCAEYSLDIVLQGREQAKALTSLLRRVQNTWQRLRRGSFSIWDFTSTRGHKRPPSSERLFLSGNKGDFTGDLVSEGMILAASIDPRRRFIHMVTFPRSLGVDYSSAAVCRSWNEDKMC